jgi:hypothetical protein
MSQMLAVQGQPPPCKRERRWARAPYVRQNATTAAAASVALCLSPLGSSVPHRLAFSYSSACATAPLFASEHRHATPQVAWRRLYRPLRLDCIDKKVAVEVTVSAVYLLHLIPLFDSSVPK